MIKPCIDYLTGNMLLLDSCSDYATLSIGNNDSLTQEEQPTNPYGIIPPPYKVDIHGGLEVHLAREISGSASSAFSIFTQGVDTTCTGTCSTVAGSKTVTGNGTIFLTELPIATQGDWIYLKLDGIYYKVDVRVSDTEVTLAKPALTTLTDVPVVYYEEVAALKIFSNATKIFVGTMDISSLTTDLINNLDVSDVKLDFGAERLGSWVYANVTTHNDELLWTRRTWKGNVVLPKTAGNGDAFCLGQYKDDDSLFFGYQPYFNDPSYYGGAYDGSYLYVPAIANGFMFCDETGAANNWLKIDGTTGNVLIETDSSFLLVPRYKLDINGILRLQGTNAIAFGGDTTSDYTSTIYDDGTNIQISRGTSTAENSNVTGILQVGVDALQSGYGCTNLFGGGLVLNGYDDTYGKGASMVSARGDSGKSPFLLFTGYDIYNPWESSGALRQIWFGGTTFNTPDANDILFFNSTSYSHEDPTASGEYSMLCQRWHKGNIWIGEHYYAPAYTLDGALPRYKLDVGDGDLRIRGANVLGFGGDKDNDYDCNLYRQDAGKLQSDGSIEATAFVTTGSAWVADGTYTTGIGSTTNGTITISNGVITAIVEAV
jgi:hypothetical protein